MSRPTLVPQLACVGVFSQKCPITLYFLLAYGVARVRRSSHSKHASSLISKAMSIEQGKGVPLAQ